MFFSLSMADTTSTTMSDRDRPFRTTGNDLCEDGVSTQQNCAFTSFRMHLLKYSFEHLVLLVNRERYGIPISRAFDCILSIVLDSMDLVSISKRPSTLDFPHYGAPTKVYVIIGA